MRTNRAWWLGVGLIGAGSAALFAHGDETKSAGGAGDFKPAASLNSLMDGQNEKFEAIGKLLEDAQAKNRANRLFIESELLAEFANVNIQHKAETDYRNWATLVRDTALDLAKEAKKRKDADETKMSSLYAKLQSTCEACHDKYR